MQRAGKTVEIGYSCFAMNIKGGRGFPGTSLHSPIKRSCSLILIKGRPMRNRWGEVAVLGSSEEWGYSVQVLQSVKVKGNREMIVRRNEWRESE